MTTLSTRLLLRGLVDDGVHDVTVADVGHALLDGLALQDVTDGLRREFGGQDFLLLFGRQFSPRGSGLFLHQTLGGK